MSGLFNKYRSFKDQQEGSATIEFVFLFPAFMFLFLTGFESGYYMVRNVMLERAVDVAVRDVRLGNGNVPSFVALKQRICEQASIIPDCTNNVQIELQPVAITPGSTAPLRTAFKCVDKMSNDDPLTGTTYDVGSENQMMVVRVCALSKPLFPTTGIGVGMRVDAEGNYAIVATTAFVNEPGNRSIAPDPIAAASGINGGGGGGPIGDNGFGNGDQDAPGASLSHNEAENDQTYGTGQSLYNGSGTSGTTTGNASSNSAPNRGSNN